MPEVTQLKIDMAKLQTDISYIKNDVSDIKETVKGFIEKADCTYATKEEHKTQTQKIEKLEALVNRIMWAVIVALIGFFVGIIREIIINNLLQV